MKGFVSKRVICTQASLDDTLLDVHKALINFVERGWRRLKAVKFNTPINLRAVHQGVSKPCSIHQ